MYKINFTCTIHISRIVRIVRLSYTEIANYKTGENDEVPRCANAATTVLSDYALAKKLNISRNTVSAWRNRGCIPNDDILDQLAELSGLPVEKVYFAAYAEKFITP